MEAKRKWNSLLQKSILEPTFLRCIYPWKRFPSSGWMWQRGCLEPAKWIADWLLFQLLRLTARPWEEMGVWVPLQALLKLRWVLLLEQWFCWNRHGVGVGIGLATLGHQCQLSVTHFSPHAWKSGSPDNEMEDKPSDKSGITAWPWPSPERPPRICRDMVGPVP